MRRLAIALLLLSQQAFAQCAMCRANAASQPARAMESLNAGIFILMIPPVAILGAILVVAFRYRD